MIISDRKIVKTKHIPESLDKVWWRWTTHEGLQTFFGVENTIELIPHGRFEIYFLMNNPEGLRGSEGCTILTYLPKKMLSFSWNAPPEFDEVRNSDYKTWVVVEFNEIAMNEVEIIVTHLGWPDNELWDPVYQYFDEAWGYVLNRLP